MNRRKLLVTVAATALVTLAATVRGGSPALAEQARIFPDDRILGPADAPITLIEYSSLTCPHCASFHAEALPQIKKKWIAEGKVRLVYRHFPLGGLALRAAAVANCVEGPGYFNFLDVLFKSQQRWAKAQDPLKVLRQFARLAGLSAERFDACLNDTAELDRIMERARDGRRSYDVTSTPTLIVNGRKVEGGWGLAKLEPLFEKLAPGS